MNDPAEILIGQPAPSGPDRPDALTRAATALLALLAAATAVDARSTSLVMLPLLACVVADVVRRRRWRDVPVDALALAPWVAWQSISRAAATSVGEGLRLRTGWYRIGYPVVGSLRLDRSAIRTVLRAMFAAHSVLIVLALLQRAVTIPGVDTLLLRDHPVRLAGWSGHPNTYAGALALVLVLNLCVGVLDDHRWLRWSPLLAVGLILTGSRSYLGAVVVCAVVLTLVAPRRRIAVRWAMGLLLLAVVAGLLAPDLVNRLGQSATPERNASRLHSWEVSWETFVDHPVLGVGAGVLPEVLEPYVASEYVDNAAQGHSLYLHELAETGVVGAVLLLGGYAWYLRKLARRFDRAADPLVGGLQLAGALAIVVLLVDGLFDHNASNGLVTIVLSLVLGLAEGHHRWWEQEGRHLVAAGGEDRSDDGARPAVAT